MLYYLIRNDNIDGRLLYLTRIIHTIVKSTVLIPTAVDNDFLKLSASEYVNVVLFENDDCDENKEQIENALQASFDIPILDNKTMRQMNATFRCIADIPKKKVEWYRNNYYAENGYPLNESFVIKGISVSECEKIFVKELLKISPSNKELTIIDPYIFPNRCDTNYPQLFCSLISQLNVSNIRIVTNASKINLSIRNVIESTLNVPVVVLDDSQSNFHDRYWLVEENKKGILIGTSLNGLGKKNSTILQLPETDCEEILKEVCKCITII